MRDLLSRVGDPSIGGNVHRGVKVLRPPAPRPVENAPCGRAHGLRFKGRRIAYAHVVIMNKIAFRAGHVFRASESEILRRKMSNLKWGFSASHEANLGHLRHSADFGHRSARCLAGVLGRPRA